MIQLKPILFFCLSLFIFMGCQHSDDPETLDFSGDLFADGNRIQEISSEPHVVKIAVTSNSQWLVKGGTGWCVPDKTIGQGNDTLTLDIKINVSQESREATLILQNPDVRRAFRIIQQGASEEYHYQLPVVFHILYTNAADRNQNIDADRLLDVLEECNRLYRDNNNSVDMNLEFIPATTNPQGEILEEPGIHRIQRANSTMDCDVFMSENNHEDAALLWDPNQYINIMVYTFSNENVLGITHIPYTVSASPLAGLKVGDRYLVDPELSYPHCVSINAKYVYTEHPLMKVPYLLQTLSHELGHYLGLFHVFNDKGGCNDPDFCEDTPTYDRDRYEEWLQGIDVWNVDFQNLATRTNCEGENYVSYNIMDYDYTYSNLFTLNQRERIRHVLQNSPLIPGPKIETAKTKSELNMEIPKVRTIK